jgi:hypothetical protein
VSTDQMQGIVAIFVPLLVAVLKRDGFSQTVNSLIAIAVYVVVGVLSVLVSGQALDVNNIMPAVAIFVAGGTIAYQLFWKNWGDPQIAAKLNGGPTPPAA